jgi:thiamine pyrophosphate-dependent acetolactate synthase large subunit-like protein
MTEPFTMTERMPRRQAAKELSEKLGVPVTEAMLAKWASQSRGPRFALLFGRAYYSRAALDEWADAMLADESPASGPRRKAA